MAVKIISISEVRKNIKKIISLLEATGDPYFITQYSHPKAVLVRFEDYNNLVEQAEQSKLIERRSNISGGEPILRGTRITVRTIVERFKAGHTIEDILDALPHLSNAQVYSALAYYHSHWSEIDHLIDNANPKRVIEDGDFEVKQAVDGVVEVLIKKGIGSEG